ncbi:uncharacterized protein TNCV_3362681 [Trichonephila clavipes]|nr:uncharacterized protein TNCV_3362681 [Trichonephila clavipes]
MEDSERWPAVGRIEAVQSITDVALFLRRSSFCNLTFMETTQTTQTVVRRPVSGQPRVTTPRKIDILRYCSQAESQSDSTRVTSMVTASIGYRTDLHIFKRDSVTAVRYRDEVLEPIVRLYAAAVGRTFVLMDDNARPHRADIVDDYLRVKELRVWRGQHIRPTLIPLKIFGMLSAVHVSSRFLPPAALIELETALQEE